MYLLKGTLVRDPEDIPTGTISCEGGSDNQQQEDSLGDLAALAALNLDQVASQAADADLLVQRRKA
jgi:hypothetical protein